MFRTSLLDKFTFKGRFTLFLWSNVVFQSTLDASFLLSAWKEYDAKYVLVIPTFQL